LSLFKSLNLGAIQLDEISRHMHVCMHAYMYVCYVYYILRTRTHNQYYASLQFWQRNNLKNMETIGNLFTQQLYDLKDKL